MFGVSRQTYYKAEKRRILLASNNDKYEILGLVKRIRNKLPRIGTRKIYHMIKEELKQRNIQIGRDRLFKLLREEEMLIKRRKRQIRTTNSRHSLRKYPNLIFTPKSRQNI